MVTLMHLAAFSAALAVAGITLGILTGVVAICYFTWEKIRRARWKAQQVKIRRRGRMS